MATNISQQGKVSGNMRLEILILARGENETNIVPGLFYRSVFQAQAAGRRHRRR